MIQVFQPTLGPEEKAAAAAVLASGWVGFGPKVLAFEWAWAAHIGVPAENVVSVSCATEGLFQIFEQLAITHAHDRRDSVIIPAISFIGITNAVLSTAFNPVLCDVDQHTLNPMVADIARKLDKHTLAVCIQHYGGVPSDLGPIAEFCREQGLLLVEDCACAPLSFYDGKRAGTFGDFAVWSFDSMKIITSGGDGGMVYCKNPDDAECIRQATRLGQSQLSGQQNSGPRWWEFQVAEPGRRALMNDLQAAVGLVQLGRLEEFVVRRGQFSTLYSTRLAADKEAKEWRFVPNPYVITPETSSYYSFWIQTDRRDELASYLRDRDIYTTFRYWPPYKAYNWGGDYPGAEWAAARTLNLPLHANLTREDVERICDCIISFYR